METTDINNEPGKANVPTSTIEEAIEERVEKFTQAQNTVNKYAAGSMAVGLVPIPLLDFVALTSVQLQMLQNLATQYDVEFSKEIVKPLIGSLLGGALPITAAAPLASVIKVVPVIGQVSGMVSMAVLGGAGTYAVGKIFIEHFESGGTFLTFDPEKVREKFQAFYEKGKEFATAQTAQSAKS
jgi:uncharacterized protein (DUF697 family)